MNKEEFEEALMELCPAFELRKDRKGQIVIHTGLVEDDFGELVSLDDEEDDDVDLAEEDDLFPLDTD